MYRVLSRKNAVVRGKFKHKPDSDGGAVRVRGFVPVTQDWVNETTSEGTYTISLSSVVNTSACAAAVVVRLQDDSVNSYVEVRSKASASTNSAAKIRLVCNNTASTGPQIHHGVVPLNSDREVMYTIYDAKSATVQTASVGLVGYYL